MEGLEEFYRQVMAKPQIVAVPAALFFLLAPGNFVTIPGAANLIELTTVSPNRTVILVHAILFGISLALIKKNLYPKK